MAARTASSGARLRARLVVATVGAALIAAAAGTALLQARGEPPTPSPTNVALGPMPTVTPTQEPSTAAPTFTPAPTPTAVPTSAPAPTPAPAPAPGVTAAPRPTGHPGATGVPASLLGSEWEVLPTDRRVVALTFDAGANADAVEPILAALAADDVRATFFLTGAWVEHYPDLTRRIGARHPIGNHSYDHAAFTRLDDAQVRDQLDRTRAAIRAATGQDDRPLFRFPFGDRDGRTTAVVNEVGYGSIRWTVDTLGWKGTSGGLSADAVVQRVLDTLRPGQIVLMHVGSHPQDGSTLDADALPRLIDEVRARGYEFVTVTEIIATAS